MDYSCFLLSLFLLFEKRLFDWSLRIDFIDQASHDFGSLAFCAHVVHDASVLYLQVLYAVLLFMIA